MSLVNYRLFNPPFELEFDKMRPSEARAYFQWFKDQIPIRIGELQRVFKSSHPSVDLDYSIESLKKLGEWFDSQVSVRPLSTSELAEQRANAPTWLHPYLPTSTYTVETISLCFDIGMYFAEVLRSRNPNLYWDYVRSPKRSADLHQPVLKPFRNGHLNPFRIMVVIAGKVHQGKSASVELLEALRVWEGFVLH